MSGGMSNTPHPMMRMPHITQRLVRHEDASHGTACATPAACQLAHLVPLAVMPPRVLTGTTCAIPVLGGRSDGDRSAPPFGVQGRPPSAASLSVAHTGEQMFYFAARSGDDSN